MTIPPGLAPRRIVKNPLTYNYFRMLANSLVLLLCQYGIPGWKRGDLPRRRTRETSFTNEQPLGGDAPVHVRRAFPRVFDE